MGIISKIKSLIKPPVKPTQKVVTTPQKTLPSINIRPSDAPGQATQRAITSSGGSSRGGGSSNQPTSTVTSIPAKELPPINIKETDAPGQATARAKGIASGLVNPNTGLRYNTINAPPSTFQKFKELSGEEGSVVKGTLATADYLTQNLLKRYQVATGDYTQSEGTQNLITAVTRTAPYFTPAAPYLLLAGAVENLATPYGQKALKNKEGMTEISLSESNNPLVSKNAGALSKLITYGSPAVEGTFGAIGLKADVNKLLVGRNLKNAQTKFLSVAKPSGVEGTTKINTVAITKIGDEKYSNFLTALVKSNKDVGVSKGFGSVIKTRESTIDPFTMQIYKNLEVFPYLSKGFSQKLGQVTNKLKTSEGLTFSKPATTEGVFSKSWAKFNDREVSTNLIGQVRTDGSVTSFLGTDKPKLRIYKQGGVKYSYGMGDVNVKGKIFDKTIQSTGANTFGFMERTSSNPLNQIVRKTSQSQVSSAISSAKTLYKSQSTPMNIIRSPLIGGGVSSAISMAKANTMSPSLAILDTRTKNKERTKVTAIPNLDVGVKTNVKTGSGYGFSSGGGQTLLNRQVPREGTAQVTGLVQVPRLDTPQRSINGTIPHYESFPGETPKPGITLTGLDLPNKKKKGFEMGYSAQVKIDSTKGYSARWIPLVENVDKMSALSLASSFVDDSNLSSQFRINKTNKPAQNTKQVSTWLSVAHKFRNYMVQKGNQVSMQNRYIERQKYRLDSPTEKRNIQMARGFGIANRFTRRKR